MLFSIFAIYTNLKKKQEKDLLIYENISEKFAIFKKLQIWKKSVHLKDLVNFKISKVWSKLEMLCSMFTTLANLSIKH